MSEQATYGPFDGLMFFYDDPDSRYYTDVINLKLWNEFLQAIE